MTKTVKQYAMFLGCLFAAFAAGRGFGEDPWWEALLAVAVAVGITALIAHFALSPFVNKTEDNAQEK